MAAPSGLVIAWPSTVASIPAGWSRVAALDSVFPRGNATATGTGGGAHTHNGANHSHTQSHGHASAVSSSAVVGVNVDFSALNAEIMNATHSHNTTYGTDSTASDNGTSASASSGSGTTQPPWYTVIWIQSDGTTDIPSGGVMWWGTGTAPTDWAIADGTATTPDLRGRWLQGAGVGADGGASGAGGHTHSMPGHTHAGGSHGHSQALANDSSGDPNWGSSGTGATVANRPHSHTVTGDTGSTALSLASGGTSVTSDAASSSEPPWYSLNHIKRTAAGATIAVGLIGLTVGSVPSGWQSCDGTNGTPNLNGANRFIVGTDATHTINTTGGSASHTHTAATHTHTNSTHTHTGGTTSNGPTTTVVLSGTTVTVQTSTHTHTTAANSGAISGASAGNTSDSLAASADNNPAYQNVIFIQKLAATGGPFLNPVISAGMRLRGALPTLQNSSLRLIGMDRIFDAPGMAPDVEIPPAQRLSRHTPYARTISNNALRLQGCDTIWGASGQVPDIEIPRAQVLPKHYDRTITNPALRVLGQDTIFGPPGKAPSIDIAPARKRSPSPGQFTSNDAKRLMGQDSIFGAAGQAPSIDIPAARTPSKHYDKFILNFSSLIDTLLAVYPFLPIEIVASQARARHIYEIITNDASRLIGLDTLFGASGQVPDIEIPPAQRLPRSGSFFSNPSLRLYGLDILFGDPGQVPDVEIPRAQNRSRPPVLFIINDASRLIGMDSIFGDIGQAPSIDIPSARKLPRIPGQFISNDASRLIGLDTLFGASGQASSIDIPSARKRAPKYPEFLTNDSSRLVGQDTIFGALGEVPVIHLINFIPRKPIGRTLDPNTSIHFFYLPSFSISDIIDRVPKYMAVVELPAYTLIVELEYPNDRRQL